MNWTAINSISTWTWMFHCYYWGFVLFVVAWKLLHKLCQIKIQETWFWLRMSYVKKYEIAVLTWTNFSRCTSQPHRPNYYYGNSEALLGLHEATRKTWWDNFHHFMFSTKARTTIHLPGKYPRKRFRQCLFYKTASISCTCLLLLKHSRSQS